MRIFPLLLLLILSTNLHSQTKSQKTQKKHTREDIKRFNYLDSLAEYYAHEDYNPDSLIKYCDLHLDIAIKLKEYGKTVDNFSNYIFELLKKDLQKADSICSVMLQYEDQLTDEYGDLGIVYQKKAQILSKQKKIEESIHYYKKSYENLGPANWLLKADALFYAGAGHAEMGEFTNAINTYEQAYKIYQSEEDQEYMLY